MSDIQFHCPACEKHLVVDEKGAGRQVPCPDCGTQITIPAAAPEPPPPEELHPDLGHSSNPVLTPNPSSGLSGLHIKSKQDDADDQHGEDINVDQPFAKKKDQWFTTNHGKKFHFCYYNSHGRMMSTACEGEHIEITAQIALDFGKINKKAYCKACLDALDMDVSDIS